MKKATLYIDDQVWKAWRTACINRNTSASKEAEIAFRQILAKWENESKDNEHE